MTQEVKKRFRHLVKLHCQHVSKPLSISEILVEIEEEEYNAELMLQHLLLWIARSEIDESK